MYEYVTTKAIKDELNDRKNTDTVIKLQKSSGVRAMIKNRLTHMGITPVGVDIDDVVAECVSNEWYNSRIGFSEYLIDYVNRYLVDVVEAVTEVLGVENYKILPDYTLKRILDGRDKVVSVFTFTNYVGGWIENYTFCIPYHDSTFFLPYDKAKFWKNYYEAQVKGTDVDDGFYDFMMTNIEHEML